MQWYEGILVPRLMRTLKPSMTLFNYDSNISSGRPLSSIFVRKVNGFYLGYSDFSYLTMVVSSEKYSQRDRACNIYLFNYYLTCFYDLDVLLIMQNR